MASEDVGTAGDRTSNRGRTTPTRRRFLGVTAAGYPASTAASSASAAVLAGLAGCIGRGTSELVVENGFDRQVTVAVEITRLSDGLVVLTSQPSVASGTTVQFPIADEGGSYRVSVVATDANAGGSELVQVPDDGAVRLRATVVPGGVDFTLMS